MTPAAATLYTYRLPLTQAVPLVTGTLTEREGLVLAMRDADGNTGYGDIAPLPGFSVDSLDEAKGQATDLLPKLLSNAPRENLHGSVQFGLETAMLFLGAVRSGASPATLLDPSARAQVTLNALLAGDRDTILARAENLLAEGFFTAKLKVGRQAIADDVALVHAVTEATGGRVRLRIDANRAWSYDDAQAFVADVASLPIDYLEEPLADAGRLPEFCAVASIKIALDESLRDGSVNPDRIKPPTIAVAKPTLHGALRGTLAATAQRPQVISSSFESGLGLCALAHLAAAANSEDTAAGLDTYAWLAEDVLLDPLPIRDGRILITDLAGLDQRINFDCLEEIAHVD
jgi:O-succinylbenzoate synthase